MQISSLLSGIRLRMKGESRFYLLKLDQQWAG